MKIFKFIFSRLSFIMLAGIIEIFITYSIFHWFSSQATWIETVLRILSFLLILYIYKNSRHLSADIVWILLIVAFPVPGTFIYLLLGANIFTSPTYRRISYMTKSESRYYRQDGKLLEKMIEEAPDYAGQFRYIADASGFPFYENTGFDYYELGEKGFPVMLEELRKAKKFIFLEYFIVKKGKMWDEILKILKEKAKEGIDVRVMYDDFGSFFSLSASYVRKLEEQGIKCISFNRINPILSVILNHRDHRKIMIVDGKTAFSGGINIADEYINVGSRFGIWKDNVIRIEGEAVWSYTVMFLTHWNALRKEDNTFLSYKALAEKKESDGYIAPYCDTPLDNEIVGQNIYMGIINQANEYCYISTPYLIIDSELINALILSAKHGVDVRIITPGIPDKKIVYRITRSYYQALIEGGVKIYEYTPGFNHAKVFVADDKIATVGTINLDYRSLYLHFENGTCLYGSDKIRDIRKDLEEMIEVSHEVGLKEAQHGPLREFFMGILRLFAPLM